MNSPFFLFYEEPDPDRWIKFDHLPRRFIRRLLRGPYRPGGVMRWFLNLQAGLDEMGFEYRLNDYRGLRRHPGAVAHVIGKPHVVEKIPTGHPIVFGPGVSAHPNDDAFWNRPDLKCVVLSCDWFQRMYARDLPRPIPTVVWPAGVDLHRWQGPPLESRADEVLVYDKIRWERERYEPELLQPILTRLREQHSVVHHLKYGSYHEEDYESLLKQVRAMVFLCEHETQGFAYLQALSCGVPLLAWDRGGEWRDPAHYPRRVRFGPVSSVPYWDERCGIRFANWEEFDRALPRYLSELTSYSPRDYVAENFDLVACARRYLEIVRTISPA